MTPWTIACQAPLSTEFSRQEYWRGLPFTFLGIFSMYGLNPGLFCCGQILYCLTHWRREWLPTPVFLPRELHGQSVSLPAGKSLPLAKLVHKIWKMWLLLQMCRHLYKATRITKNQENRTPPKDYCKPPVNNTVRSPTKREIQEFPRRIQNNYSKNVQITVREHNLRISGKQYKNKRRH